MKPTKRLTQSEKINANTDLSPSCLKTVKRSVERKKSKSNDMIQSTSVDSKFFRKENCIRSKTNQQPKNKLQLVQEAKVGNQHLEFTLEFETEKIPERGSDEMYKAIFKAAKTCGRTTEEDMRQIDKDIQKFWGKPLPHSTEKIKKGSSKKKIPVSTDVKDKPKEAADGQFTQDTLDLFDAIDKLVNSPLEEESSTKKSTAYALPSSSTSGPVKGTKKLRGRPKKATKKLPEIVELSSDDDSVGKDAEILPRGSLLVLRVIFRNQTYSVCMYESQKIKNLRDDVGKQAHVEPAYIEMYLGDFIKLEDDQTLADCGLTSLCEIDAFYRYRSDEEIYESGSSAVMRLKCQTSDRRGRQTIFIYVKKTAKMRQVRDDYAQQMGMDPLKLRLSFDGEILCLDSTPEECELEGDELIDVLICS